MISDVYIYIANSVRLSCHFKINNRCNSINYPCFFCELAWAPQDKENLARINPDEPGSYPKLCYLWHTAELDSVPGQTTQKNLGHCYCAAASIEVESTLFRTFYNVGEHWALFVSSEVAFAYCPTPTQLDF